MKPLDLRKTPDEFRTFVPALLRQPDPETALVRLLATLGPWVPPVAAAAFALQLRNSLAESALLRRTTEYFLRAHNPTTIPPKSMDKQESARQSYQPPRIRPLDMIDLNSTDPDRPGSTPSAQALGALRSVGAKADAAGQQPLQGRRRRPGGFSG